MFRNGYWQKIVIILLILAQLALLIWFCYATLSDAYESKYAIWWFFAVWALSFSLAVFIVNTDSAVEYKVAWLVLVGVLPLIGSVLYLFFAHKLRTRKEKKRLQGYYAALSHEPTNPEVACHLAEEYPEAWSVSHYLEEASDGAVYSNSSVEYFPLGDLAFPSMLREIKKAKHYIFIEYFIITPGEFWNALLQVLRDKANEGVDVRVVYDDVGNLGSTPVRYWNELRGYGIKAYAFSRIKPILDIRMNNRDHRKILVIDGHTGFTGGMNLADEYINKLDKYGHWKDNAIMIKGKAVYGLTLLFLANWFISFEPSKPIDYEYYRPERYIDEAGGFPISDGYVQPYGDMPYSNDDVGEGAYLSILGKARRYVYISTPYLILDDKLKNALQIAALQGVDVRILTPGVPDKKTVYQLTRCNYGDLLHAGVKIFEYTPGFVHQKMFVADDLLATIGTINLDYRSLYLHQECATFLAGNRCIGTMKQDFIDTLQVSHEVTLEEWTRWSHHQAVTWALLKLIAPLL